MAGANMILDDQHREVLDRAIRNVLGTDLALQTYSQIVDGLPLAPVAHDQYLARRTVKHPIAHHTSLCAGAVEIAQGILSETDIDAFGFDAKLLEAYQSARLGERSFHCRFIELVAVAVHKTAVVLFNQRHRIHDRHIEDPAHTIDAVTSWFAQPLPGCRTIRPGPTMFMTLCYGAVEQYPDGLADVVGYWAENFILGGVVIFDRSESWDDESSPEPNVYLHSDRGAVTFRLWQALDEQQQSLVNFLLSSSDNPQPCPFPISPSERNLKRLDPDHATRRKVYRDIWERAPAKGAYDHCVKSVMDYPERARWRREGEPRW